MGRRAASRGRERGNMKVEITSFGKTRDGRAVSLYTLSNSKGMKASFTDYGAILVALSVPDGNGALRDVVLGFDTVEGYFDNPSFFGATIGPNANRIADACFSIDGKTYHMDANDNGNNLHSHASLGFHKRLWQAQVTEEGVTFSIEDADGALGLPGNKKMRVACSLDEEDGLTLHYHGSSDQKTILNPTNHTYFNLKGHGKGDIEDHRLWMAASCYTPVREGSIPTGEVVPVAGTVMDFTESKLVGKEIDVQTEQLLVTGGYDHNWVIDGWDGTLRHFATLESPDGLLKMDAYSTLPGFQFYAGNCILPQVGKDGARYGKRSGLCLETQYFPNSVNQDNFPSCVFGPGREYDSITVYRFA